MEELDVTGKSTELFSESSTNWNGRKPSFGRRIATGLLATSLILTPLVGQASNDVDSDPHQDRIVLADASTGSGSIDGPDDLTPEEVLQRDVLDGLIKPNPQKGDYTEIHIKSVTGISPSEVMIETYGIQRKMGKEIDFYLLVNDSNSWYVALGPTLKRSIVDDNGQVQLRHDRNGWYTPDKPNMDGNKSLYNFNDAVHTLHAFIEGYNAEDQSIINMACDGNFRPGRTTNPVSRYKIADTQTHSDGTFAYAAFTLAIDRDDGSCEETLVRTRLDLNQRENGWKVYSIVRNSSTF